MSEISRSIMPMFDLATNSPALQGGGTPGAGTAYFASPLVVPSQCMRVSVCYSPSALTTLGYKRNGGPLCNLNSGSALAAGSGFSFVISARPGDTLNFQDSAGATVRELLIEGMHGRCAPRAASG